MSTLNTLNTFKRVALTTVIAASLTGLAGCEWDNSDEWDDNGTNTTTEPPSNGGSGDESTDENEGGNLGPKISGTLTTRSSLEGASLCLDTNSNLMCDESEPSVSLEKQGNWELYLGEGERITEDTRMVFTPKSKTPSLTGTVKPNLSGGDVSNVLVSMIATLKNQEQARLQALGDNEAERKAFIEIADLVKTSQEELQAYLHPNNIYGYTINPSERNRLERLDKLGSELMSKIDESISPGDKANLTPDEINDLINDQISNNMPAVVDEVDTSQVTHPDDEDFQDILDNVTSNPALDEALTTPETTKTSAQAQLEQRIDQALSEEPESNYFEEDGFERFPVLGDTSTTYDVELLPTGNTLPGSPVVYYEARQRVAVSIENGETAVTDLNIVIPKEDDTGNIRPITLKDEYWWGYFESGNTCDVPACDDLRVRPQIINTHTWEIQSFQPSTIKLGHSDRIYMTAVDNNGSVVASNRNTGFTSKMIFHPFNLNGLPIRTVVKELYGIDLPTKAEAGIEDPQVPETLTFDNGTSAADQTLGYGFSDRTGQEVLMTDWGPGGTRENNTNRVYGESGSAARTLDDLMYATRTPYAGPDPTQPDTEIRNALKISGPTNEVYVARLIGQASAEEGIISIDRFNEATQQWEPIKPMGAWKKDAYPFPRIDLDLPGGFRYSEANPGLRLGEAFLYEYSDGYVHHGWRLPQETDVATLVGRRKVNFVLSTGAFNQLTEGLETLGLLQHHPSDLPEPEPENNGGY